MARNLSDVLHYFGPELAEAEAQVRPAEDAPRAEAPACRIIGVPIGSRDVVRAAFAWNIAVEVVRLGGRATILCPDETSPSPLWPQASTGPLGVALRPSLAQNLDELLASAQDWAANTAHKSESDLLLVRIPPEWISAAVAPSPLLDWVLLFTSSEEANLQEALALTRNVVDRHPGARVGITIHGAQSREEAETAFGNLARASREKTGRDVRSYGLLVDDLDVYRAIVAQRPIGLAHPQSPAARALRDVAELLLGDIEEDARG
ncbi:MAG: hypothetical protein P8Q97_08050 [Myxococcota bacterium]|jgi:hypothetical protein|nr:hypothetical protein [Myxococcota bacterium]